MTRDEAIALLTRHKKKPFPGKHSFWWYARNEKTYAAFLPAMIGFEVATMKDFPTEEEAMEWAIEQLMKFPSEEVDVKKLAQKYTLKIIKHKKNAGMAGIQTMWKMPGSLASKRVAKGERDEQSIR